MKNFFTYPVFVVLFLSFVGMLGYGALLKHHYIGGEKFKNLQNIAVIIAEVPSNIRNVFFSSQLLLAKQKPEFKDYNPGFNFKNKKKLDILFLLNYTNPSDAKHEINLIDLQTYRSIFKYKVDYELFTKIKSINNKKFQKYITKDNFALRSTFLTKDLNFISLTTGNIIVKFSPKKNNIIWFNDDYNFHHTFYVNEVEKYIWAIGCSKNSKLDKKYLTKNFCDDSIIKIDLNTGKIVEEISVTQIMIQAGLSNHLFIGRLDKPTDDPLHINDVEEVISNTSFTDKGNLFVSVGHTNMILLINPYTKKILWKLQDKLFHQHDIDIINDDEIAIFNNNRIVTNKNKVYKNNEIFVYNFKNNQLSSPYDSILNKNNVRTVSQGLMEITKYGIFVEEQNYGRYIFFEKNGNVIFEYLNKSNIDSNVYQVHWSRLITNKDRINEIKRKLKNENN